LLQREDEGEGEGEKTKKVSCVLQEGEGEEEHYLSVAIRGREIGSARRRNDGAWGRLLLAT
jgi:hypothetical protein